MFWQTGAREERERQERAQQRAEERDDKLREHRLDLFSGFLQDCNAVRHAIGNIAGFYDLFDTIEARRVQWEPENPIAVNGYSIELIDPGYKVPHAPLEGHFLEETKE